jgi:SAGA-associated factor 29
MNPDTIETIGRVNRLIAGWPTDDMLPADGFEGLKSTYRKLSAGLHGVQNTAEEEIK